MKIALDIDGVLADYVKAFVTYIRNIHPNAIPSEWVPTEWHFDVPGLSRTQVSKLRKQMHSEEDFWLHMSPYSQSLKTMQDFLRLHPEHDVMYLTARPYNEKNSTIAQTNMWLTKHHLHNARTTLVIVEDHTHKAAVLKATGTSFFVDDRVATVLETHKVQTCKSFVLTRPWNFDGIVEHTHINAVGSVEDFLERVLNEK